MDFNFYSWCIMYCIYIIYILYTTSPSFFKGSFLPFIFASPPSLLFFLLFLPLPLLPCFILPSFNPSSSPLYPSFLVSFFSFFSGHSFFLSYLPFPSFLPSHLPFFLIHVHGPNPFSHLFWTPLTFSSLLFNLFYFSFFPLAFSILFSPTIVLVF